MFTKKRTQKHTIRRLNGTQRKAKGFSREIKRSASVRERKITTNKACRRKNSNVQRRTGQRTKQYKKKKKNTHTQTKADMKLFANIECIGKKT